jgi:hypothetical protein
MTSKRLNAATSGFFQQSLQDLIRSVRAHRRDEAEFLAKKFAQVQQECQSTDSNEKAIAVLKLLYVRRKALKMGENTDKDNF